MLSFPRNNVVIVLSYLLINTTKRTKEIVISFTHPKSKQTFCNVIEYNYHFQVAIVVQILQYLGGSKLLFEHEYDIYHSV